MTGESAREKTARQTENDVRVEKISAPPPLPSEATVVDLPSPPPPPASGVEKIFAPPPLPPEATAVDLPSPLPPPASDVEPPPLPHPEKKTHEKKGKKKKKKKKKKKEEQKPLEKMKDELWAGAAGIGLLIWARPPEAVMTFFTLVFPALIAAGLIDLVRIRWRPDRRGGLLGKGWEKMMEVLDNHGSGLYGLITLLVFFRSELIDLEFDLPRLTLDLGELIDYWLVERWIDAFANGWQAFLWPLDWMGEMGIFGMGGMFAVAYGLYGFTRAFFEWEPVITWIEREGRS